MSSSEKPGQLPSFDLGRLEEHSRLCSDMTNVILQCHVRFAFLMAERIDDASRPQSSLNYDSSETTRLADNISTSASSLSEYVERMKDDLESFVSDLEDVQFTLKKELSPQVTAKKESWLAKILGWLKSLFDGIASLLRLASCVPISVFHSSAGPRRRPVSALQAGANRFCTANSGAFLEHIILPLQGQK
jgi:hypothetical protein